MSGYHEECPGCGECVSTTATHVQATLARTEELLERALRVREHKLDNGAWGCVGAALATLRKRGSRAAEVAGSASRREAVAQALLDLDLFGPAVGWQNTGAGTRQEALARRTSSSAGYGGRMWSVSGDKWLRDVGNTWYRASEFTAVRGWDNGTCDAHSPEHGWVRFTCSLDELMAAMGCKPSPAPESYAQ